MDIIKTEKRCQQLCHCELVAARHARSKSIVLNHAPGNNSSIIRDQSLLQYTCIVESIGQVNNYTILLLPLAQDHACTCSYFLMITFYMYIHYHTIAMHVPGGDSVPVQMV
jgi:hypothetical protein